MKKFLPLIVFILVFTGTLVTQFAWQTINAETPSKKTAQYTQFENLFLKGSFETIDGTKVINSKLKAPVIIYNFWASWCNPCLAEMPSLIAMKKQFPDEELQILAINTDEDNQLQNINKILKKLNIKNEFLVIADKNTKIAESFNLTAIPVTIIFNRGRVVHFSNGPMDFDSPEMLGKIKKWIKE